MIKVVINTVAFYRLDAVFELKQAIAIAQEEALEVVMTTFTTRGGASAVKLAYGLN